MKGIEKEIDNLGRLVIPMEYRRVLGVETNSRVLVSLSADAVIVTGVNKYCAICGEKIEIEHEIRLCKSCIEKVKQLK